MHYPYNPGISKAPFGYEFTNADESIDTSRPVQNTVPPTPGTPAPPTPPAPIPTFPTPAQPSPPGAFGPLPGTTFPFGTSPGAVMPPDQPAFPLPTTPAPVQPMPMHTLPTSPTPPPSVPFPAPVQPTPLQPVPVPTPTPLEQPTPVQQPPRPVPIESDGVPPAGAQLPLVRPVRFEGPEAPFVSAGVPTVIPEPPHFLVPGNPLLPAEYEEILSYESLQYMNGFLRTQIGKECLVSMTAGGGGAFITELGYLIGVGLNYLLLQDACSEEILICDFYSIKLVQILGKRCPPNPFI